MAYKIVYKGNVEKFEDFMLERAKQEYQTKGEGIWCKIADIYTRQLGIIEYDPFSTIRR